MLRTIGRFGMTLLMASSLNIASLLNNPQEALAGVVTLPDGGRCEGEVSNGGLNGKVTCKYANGDSFEGEFRNGEKQGQGTYIFADGTRVEGIWKDGEFQK